MNNHHSQQNHSNHSNHPIHLNHLNHPNHLNQADLPNSLMNSHTNTPVNHISSNESNIRGTKRSFSNPVSNHMQKNFTNNTGSDHSQHYQRDDDDKEKKDGNTTKRTRLRVSRACDRCRTQKIKCSGTKPCDTCLKQNRPCVYNNLHNGSSNTSNNNNTGAPIINQVPAVGVGSGSLPFQNAIDFKGVDIHDHSSSKDYIKFLENKVKYLENFIVKGNGTSGNSKNIRASINSNPIVETYLNQETIDSESEEEDCFSFSLSKWRLQRRYHNILLTTLSKNLYESLSQDSKKQVIMPRTQYFGWNMSGSHYLKSSKLPEFKELINDLNLSNKLLNYFFTNINPLFSIIFEPIMRKQLIHYEKNYKSTINSNNDNTIHNTNTNQTRLFSAQLYLIYSISMRFLEFQSNEKFPDNLEENLFQRAYEVIKILSFEWESIELIQCWLLISLYLRVAHRQTSSYASLGQAITMAKSMALNYKIPSNHNSKPFERLKAKRVFWCVYTFDKLFGLQSGKFYSMKNEDITLDFPSMNYELENDGWLSLPALMMIQLAIISSEIQTFKSESLPLEKVNMINKSLNTWNSWLNENNLDDFGFNSESDNNMSSFSPMVKTQIRLHYYDLLVNLNIRILFKYLGKKIKCEGLKIEPLISSSEGIIKIFQFYDENSILLTPWYLTLSLLFNVGIISITLINSGLYLSNSNYLLSQCINLINKIRSPITAINGEVQYQDKVTMAKECLWALKMLNHMCSLRLQESILNLKTIGIDHGPSDVNRNRFLQFGRKEKLSVNCDKNNIYNNFIKGNNFVINEDLVNQLNSSLNNNNNNSNQNVSSKNNTNSDNGATGQNASVSPSSSKLETNQNIENTPTQASNNIITNSDSNMNIQKDETTAGGMTDLSSNLFNEFSKLFSEDFSPEEDNLFGNLQWFDQWVDFN